MDVGALPGFSQGWSDDGVSMDPARFTETSMLNLSKFAPGFMIWLVAAALM